MRVLVRHEGSKFSSWVSSVARQAVKRDDNSRGSSGSMGPDSRRSGRPVLTPRVERCDGGMERAIYEWNVLCRCGGHTPKKKIDVTKPGAASVHPLSHSTQPMSERHEQLPPEPTRDILLISSDCSEMLILPRRSLPLGLTKPRHRAPAPPQKRPMDGNGRAVWYVCVDRVRSRAH